MRIYHDAVNQLCSKKMKTKGREGCGEKVDRRGSEQRKRRGRLLSATHSIHTHTHTVPHSQSTHPQSCGTPGTGLLAALTPPPSGKQELPIPELSALVTCFLPLFFSLDEWPGCLRSQMGQNGLGLSLSDNNIASIILSISRFKSHDDPMNQVSPSPYLQMRKSGGRWPS